MAKSYVPQLIRLLRRVRLYINKHNATMAPFLTPAEAAALVSIVSAISAFDGININETP